MVRVSHVQRFTTVELLLLLLLVLVVVDDVDVTVVVVLLRDVDDDTAENSRLVADADFCRLASLWRLVHAKHSTAPPTLARDSVDLLNA